jgi:hypothetical protein
MISNDLQAFSFIGSAEAASSGGRMGGSGFSSARCERLQKFVVITIVCYAHQGENGYE